MSLEARCLERISALKQENLYRCRFLTQKRQGVFVQHQGKTLISFNSNDYLGLSQHPSVLEAFKKSVSHHGIGSGGSHLLGGHHKAHEALEEALADFIGKPRALLFSTGYSANLSALTTLVDPSDRLFQDRLNHASLMDAGRYTQARFSRYQHLDNKDLEEKLEKSRSDLAWIISDGVFSVDGDIAPLPCLIKLKKDYHAALVIDDAHGVGILGNSGKGTAEHYNIPAEDITLITGSFGIALGTFGAFVAGSHTLIETLIQSARGYIYTTALPPSIADATLASLQILRSSNEKRANLKELIHYFQTCALQLGIKTLPSITPIQSILVGENLGALTLAKSLQAEGFLTGVIRPPTVPKHTARLRVALNVHHTKTQIEELLEATYKSLQQIQASATCII